MADETSEEKTEGTEIPVHEENSQKKKSEFGKTLKSYFDKGVEASKKGIKSAGSAIGEFGDKSVTKLDIAQLKGKLEKKYQELGELAAESFLSAESVSKDSAGVSEKLDAIKELKAKIGEKESSLKKYEK